MSPFPLATSATSHTCTTPPSRRCGKAPALNEGGHACLTSVWRKRGGGLNVSQPVLTCLREFCLAAFQAHRKALVQLIEPREQNLRAQRGRGARERTMMKMRVGKKKQKGVGVGRQELE